MFALVVAVISIVLVVATLAIGNFYGGSTLTEAETQAEVLRIKNEEQQLLAAADFFNADHGRFPNDVGELVQGKYLLTVPRGAKSAAVEASFSIISNAFAAATAQGWAQPMSGQPTFMTETKVPKEVCRKYNQISRGDDGILKQAFDTLAAQCYGSDNSYRVLVTKRTTLTLSAIVAPSQVVDGGLPAKDTGDIWWDSEPTGNPVAAVDPDKVPYAKLALSPTSREDFGAVQAGQTAGSSARTIVNTGNILAESISVTAPGGFALKGNTCVAGLAPGASCTFAVEFRPAAVQQYDGLVAVESRNAGAASYGVVGEGAAAHGALTSLNFGDLAAGAVQTLAAVLNNEGIGPLTLGPTTVSGAGFADVPGGTCGRTLAAGSSCTVKVSLTATGVSTHSGSLVVTTLEAGDLTANLSGRSLEAHLAVTPAARTFGSTQVGQPVDGASHAVSNDGNIAVTGLSLTAPTGYSIVGSTCSSSLAAGANCAFSIRFSPLQAGSYPGTVTVGGTNVSSREVTVIGDALGQAATLSGGAFGNVAASTAADLALVLRNTGVGPLSVTTPTSASVTGTGFGFVSTTCGNSVAAGAACTTTVRYSALGTAAASGALSIVTGAGTKTATLSGQSLQAILGYATTTNAFGNAFVGSSLTSSPRSVTNTGNTDLTGLSIAAPAGFSIGNNTCSTLLAAGASCSYTITFSPTAVKAYGGAVTISASNSASGSFSVSGTGEANVSTATLTSANTVALSSWYAEAVKTVAVTYRNDGNLNMTLSSPSLTAPLSVASNTCSNIAPGSSCAITVALTSTAVGGPGGNNGQTFTATGASNNPVGVTVNWTINSAGPRWGATNLNFGNVAVGQSASQNITLFNDGSAAFNWAANNGVYNLPAGFTFNTSACTNVAPRGGSCNVVVTFKPSASGTFGGSGIFMIQASYAPNTLTVSGTGTTYSQATLTSAAAITLADWYQPGTKTGAFTYRNDGNIAMTLSSPSLAAPLSVVGNSCSGVAPGSSCTITVALTLNAHTGGISAQTFTAAGATNNPVGVTVNWNISSIAQQWSPTSLAFGAVTVGQSASKNVTLYNYGSVAADWATNNVMAYAPGGFTFNTGGCRNVAAYGGACNVVVTFTPGSAGSFGGSNVAMQYVSWNGNLLSVSGTGVVPGFASSQFAASWYPEEIDGGWACTNTIVNKTGQTLTIVSATVDGNVTYALNGAWANNTSKTLTGRTEYGGWNQLTMTITLSNGQIITYISGDTLTIR